MNRPSARIALKFQGHDRTRLTIHGYGDDPRVPNPGDLLIAAGIGDAANGLVELAVLVHGRDMLQLATAANKAALAWEENREWLDQPVSRSAGAA